ncbi:MAG: dihydropteroate synthase [Alistipes sp.]|nr:dihydropteroate synthase [Alistipes sp.]
MAIINLTPDSFYAGSRHSSYDEVRDRVERAIEAGATIIDLGGYSSRPGAAEVTVDEEWQRVEMGLQAVRDVSAGVVVSIDTFRSEVVRRAYEGYGAFIVNDISAGEADESIVGLVAELGLPYVAMHMRGTPTTMQSLTEYECGVTRGVVEYLSERARVLEAKGVAKERIILDPGFGFAKTVEQNHELLRDLDKLRALGYPLLIGLSRKSMIYKPLGVTAEESLPGTLALVWESLRGGEAIVRVHDVAATRQVVELAKYYKRVGYDKGR